MFYLQRLGAYNEMWPALHCDAQGEQVGKCMRRLGAGVPEARPECPREWLHHSCPRKCAAWCLLVPACEAQRHGAQRVDLWPPFVHLASVEEPSEPHKMLGRPNRASNPCIHCRAPTMSHDPLSRTPLPRRQFAGALTRHLQTPFL